MFKLMQSRILWGVLLILAGVIFLLQNFFGFAFGGVFWGLLFGLGSFIFLSVYFTNREHWWALIPGFTLLGIGLTILMSSFAPGLNDILGGTFVLGGIAVAFLAVYLTNREYWWALIPFGVMTTLAFVAAVENFFSSAGTGGVFLLGLGLTFAVVALLPTSEGRMKWAWIPAGILLVMGLALIAAAENLFLIVGPAALILVGLYLIYKTMIARG